MPVLAAGLPDDPAQHRPSTAQGDQLEPLDDRSDHLRLGSNFAFRTEQNTVTSLDNWGINVNKTGRRSPTKVCNFWIHP